MIKLSLRSSIIAGLLIFAGSNSASAQCYNIVTDTVRDCLSSDILDGTIVGVDFAAETITSDKINTDAVTSSEIMDRTITTLDLGLLSVETMNLFDDAVTDAKIADNAVREVHLIDDAVTNSKIADDAVREVNIQDSAVTTNKIADDAVKLINLADSSVGSAEIVDGSVAFDDLDSSMQGRIVSLETQTYQNTKDIIDLQEATAISNAFANIPSVSHRRFVLGLGLSQFEDKTAIAGKIMAQPSDSFSLSAGIGKSGDTIIGAGGISVGF